MDDGMCVFQLVVAVICGAICSAIAAHKGRSAAGWFVCGFLTHIIGIIIIAVISNKKEELAKQEYVHMEQRRLREQLRQEQIKVEAFRRYSEARLDAHDQALGIETRDPAALPGYQPMQQALPADAAPGNGQAGQNQQWSLADRSQAGGDLPVGSTTPWYYEFNGASIGPVSDSDLRLLLVSRRISSTTLVWSQDMTDWAPAHTIPQFREVSQ